MCHKDKKDPPFWPIHLRSRHLSKVLPNDSNPVPILLCNACADAMKMLQKIIGGEIQRKDILEKIKK
jgi:hypothetical protein